MKSLLKYTVLALATFSAIVVFAQATPPWSKGDNDPAAEKGYAFHVSDIDNIPDIHGNPCGAQLVIFIGGNQFFVLPQLIAAFEEQHPELKGHIFYETLPRAFCANRLQQTTPLPSAISPSR
jgi:hypothetical protein